jgi:ribosome-associated protein
MEDALRRLANRIEESRKARKRRIPTRKSRAIRAKELEKKKKRGEIKRLRRKIRD